MTKAQIQVPEKLFERIRASSQRREWSLAETFRRGAELLLQVYPDPPSGNTEEEWTPPTSGTVGWKGLTRELRDAAFAGQDPRLA